MKGARCEKSNSGDTLTLEKLDELIDLIKGGKLDMLLMSRRSRRYIEAILALSRASGGEGGAP